MPKERGEKVIATNRRARDEYEQARRDQRPYL